MGETDSYRRRSAAQWLGPVRDYAASGLSQQAFCERRGVALSTFCHWRRRLAQEAAEPTHERALGPALRLVPLRVLDEASPGAASGIAVIAECGVRIELARGFDGATLQRVLATLDGRI
jgi:hypothetical protein